MLALYSGAAPDSLSAAHHQSRRFLLRPRLERLLLLLLLLKLPLDREEPLLLLERMRNVRKIFSGVIQSAPRVLSVLVPAAVYVLAVQFIGLYVASAIYIALFMVILGKFSWLKSVFISLSVNVLFFMMFEVWFKVPLFKGAFDMLSFLGY